jgi:hypothetical protein
MGKIYQNQPFKIEATFIEEVNGVDTPVIITGLPVAFNFIAPDGTEGTFIGVVTDGEAGKAEYEVPADTLEQSGRYTFYAVVTFANGEVPAEPQELILYQRGK